MKKLITIISIVSLISCNKEARTEAIPKNETDKVILKDNDIKSFSRYSNDNNSLIEKIYYKIIENDQNLTKLDEEISKLNDESREYKRSLDDILQKPDDYYKDAKYRTKFLKDSLLKKEILKLIESSEKNFTKNTSVLKGKMKQTNLNTISINELYSIYKIRKTLPAIEDFQKTIPNNKKIDSIINEQEKLIQQLKSLKN
ncbi:hypothetical protein C3729_08070 [Cloacibacterium normanense]|uniref:Lipoprotein n=1 Tax=Cloacibacterium normanense TaxID=237258 RepID=A0A2S7I492_9FLAO|nr:hypothetical protein [Cloacibacterium normanense]PPZ91373.1 hypothetical protein C3729_08070 [Cloacibacterium normanense]